MENCIYPNIPDWIQAIGTILASLGLIWTLYLQRKTLVEQQKITSIEETKFINSYLPIIELIDIDYQKKDQNRTLSFSMVIRENYLQKLNVTHNFPDDFKITWPRVIPNIIYSKDRVMKFIIEYTLPSVWVEVNEYSGDTIVIEFEDAFRIRYRQLVIYKGGDNLFLYPAIRK